MYGTTEIIQRPILATTRPARPVELDLAVHWPFIPLRMSLSSITYNVYSLNRIHNNYHEALHVGSVENCM